MPQIVLDATGKIKSDIIEGAYELCGLNGFEYDKTTEEMVTGLRALNDLMAELAADGLDFDYNFPLYGNGVLGEPSGIPDYAVAAVKKLLAQYLCPALGAAFSADARASLNRSWFALKGRLAASPPSMTPAYMMQSSGVRHGRISRIASCLKGRITGTTTATTPVVTVPAPPIPPAPSITLSALSLSATSFTTGTPSSGTIIGATAGSTITSSGLPAGLTINSAARTFTWDGTGSAASGSFTLTETLNDSGTVLTRTSTINYAISTVPALLVLGLSANTIPENSAATTVVGAILNKTSGSVLSLSDDAGGRFAISGGNLVAGATATNYESASSHSITIVETLAGAPNSPKSNTLSVNVSNVFEQPSLGALTLSSTSFTTGISSSGTISGATGGSTITVSGLPSGLSINGSARTWAWDGTGTTGTGTISLTETLSDSANSPRSSSVSYSINTSGSGVLDTSVPAPTLSLAVPATTYPPQLNIGLPVEYSSGTHQIHFQGDDDYLIGSPFINDLLAPNDTQAAAQTYIDTALASIASGVNFFRARIEWTVGGTTHYSNWSNTQGHGDAVAPTMASSASGTSAELAPMAFVVSANEACYFTIGGSDASLLELASSTAASSNTVRLVGNANLNYEGKASYSFTITPVDLSGNVGTTQTCTFTVTDVDEVPNTLTFTLQSNATLGATYTSNTVTIAGLAASTPVPIAVSGGSYIKNGGTATTAAGTVQNGDTLALRGVAPATDGLNTIVALAIGDPQVSAFYQIITPAGGVNYTLVASPTMTTGTSDHSYTINWPGGKALLAVHLGSGIVDAKLNGVLLTQVLATSGGDYYYILESTADIAANSSATLLVRENGSARCKVQLGKLTNANMTPTATFEKVSTNNVAHSMGPATVPGAGIAVFFWQCGVGETMSGSTEISNTDGGGFRIGTLTASGTSTLSGGSGTFAQGLGAVFQPG